MALLDKSNKLWSFKRGRTWNKKLLRYCDETTSKGLR